MMTRTRNGKRLGQHLTAKNVYTLPGPAGDSPNIDYMDASLPGFGLRVSRGGQRTWFVRYTVATTGDRRRMTLGECRADEAGVTLADARDKARKAIRKAEDGIDPMAQQQERRESETFGDLAVEYIKRHAKPARGEAVKVGGVLIEGVAETRATDEEPDTDEAGVSNAKKEKRAGKRSWKEDLRIINAELLRKDRANWKHVKVRDITRSMVREVFETITDRGAPIMANRTVALMSKMFNFALARDFGGINGNPAAVIDKNPEESRGRVLSDAEVVELWAALSETTRLDEQGRPVARLNEAMNDCIKVRFLTLTRPGEAARMRWQDIDLETGMWELPAALTKNKQQHRIPLTAPAMQIISRRLATARATSIWVFEHTPGTNVAARMKKAAAFLCKGDAHRSRRRANAKGAPKRKQRPPFLPGLSFEFRGHDSRRTAATWLGDANVADETISRLLNHVNRGPRSTPIYNRSRYDAPKLAALEVLTRRLDAILTGAKPAAILTFAGAR